MRASIGVKASAAIGIGAAMLVLLDFGLPDGSGSNLLSLANRLAPRPRVVIFSARDAGEEGAAAG